MIQDAAAGLARIASAGSADVLRVPCTYFPDAVGGTEIRVESLVAAYRRFASSGTKSIASLRRATESATFCDATVCGNKS